MEEKQNILLTVDAIINIGNYIVIIERKNEPLGYALPGGFVNNDETLLQAVIREVKEEVNLDISNIIINEPKIYDDPNRDKRGRIITAVFYTVKGDAPLIYLKAKDDAKEVLLLNINSIKEFKDKLCFDHKDIIEDYLKNTKYRF